MSAAGEWVYVGGSMVPAAQARVSVYDRGFLFGDAVYEVVAVHGGRPFLLGRHLQRLAASLQAVGIEPPLDDGEWRAIIDELVARNGGGDQVLYLEVTRGVAAREHVPSTSLEPTVVAMSAPHRFRPPEPVAAVTCADIRWQRCDIKATALLANVLLRREAAARDAYEAILVRDGCITEGAASNVFLVRGGRVYTPPLGPGILAGVTRGLLVELLAAAGVEVQQVPVPVGWLRDADELWLTSSTRDVLPVTRLDGAPVGSGAAGPLWEQAHALVIDYRRRTAGTE